MTIRAPLTDPIDLIDEAVIVFGLDMIVSAWNTAAERLYGFTREETIGNRIQAAVRCRPTATLPEILEIIHLTGEWRGEILRARKDQSTLVVRAHWRLRRRPDGQPVDIVEASDDITEFRRTREALEQVGFQYQNMFNAAAASFWELDFTAVGKIASQYLKDGTAGLSRQMKAHPELIREMVRATQILDVNEQTLTLFGRGSRDEVMRSLDPYWPDESLPAFAESVVAAFERQKFYSREVVFTSLDGRRYDTLFTVSFPKTLLPGIRILVGIVDLTAEKQARAAQLAVELRYQRFFNSLPISSMILEGDDLVAHFQRLRSEGVVDLEAYIKDHPEFVDIALQSVRIKEVNPRSLRLFQAKSVDEFFGPIARYWVDAKADFARVISARYRGDLSFETEVILRAHDGSAIHVLFYIGWAVLTGDHRLSLAAFVDVSDRVQAQQELATMQAEFAHAARVSMLGELTASIAHEVSQPLTVIATSAEAVRLWLDRSPPNLVEVAKLMQRTEREAARAAEIIGRIRSMVLRSEPVYAATDLNSLVEETMLFVRVEISRSAVELRLDLQPGLPNVLGDAVQLQQVIVNLCINAVQAMTQADTPRRQVTLRTRSCPPGRICLEIYDSGPGIAPEVLPRLFESFFTTKDAGMGMGLAICRSIVEAHNGEISAGNWGGGAAFTIELPAHHGPLGSSPT